MMFDSCCVRAFHWFGSNVKESMFVSRVMAYRIAGSDRTYRPKSAIGVGGLEGTACLPKVKIEDQSPPSKIGQRANE